MFSCIRAQLCALSILLQNIELKNKGLYISMAYNVVIWNKYASFKNINILITTHVTCKISRTCTYYNLKFFTIWPIFLQLLYLLSPESHFIICFYKKNFVGFLHKSEIIQYLTFCVWLISLSSFKLIAMDLGMKTIPIWLQRCNPPTKHTKFWDKQLYSTILVFKSYFWFKPEDFEYHFRGFFYLQ